MIMGFCTLSVLIPVALPEGCNPVCHFSVCSNSTQQKEQKRLSVSVFMHGKLKLQKLLSSQQQNSHHRCVLCRY